MSRTDCISETSPLAEHRPTLAPARPLTAVGLLLLLTVLSACSRSPEARRDAFLAKGKAFVEKQDYSRALLEFKNAARVTPNDAEVYYQLGVAFAGTQDFRAAFTAFKRAVELNPKHRQAQLRYAKLLALTDQKELLQDAQNRLKALLDTSADPDTLNTLAFTELKLGSPPTAVEILERALAESPGELVSSILLAQTKLSQGDASGAEAVLEKACANAPQSADAHRYLAELYILQRKLPQAEARLARALQLAPKSPVALMDLARVQLTLGRKPEAEQTFKRLREHPGHHGIYALFLLGEGRRDDGIRELERVAAAHPGDRVVRTQLVAGYLLAGRSDAARKTLEQALKQNGKDADALLQRAEIFLRERKFDQAENDVNRALKLLPAAAEVRYLLAKVYQARGAALSYRQELAKAVELNPALLPVRLELARALTQANQARAAMSLLAEAPESQRESTPLLVERNWALWGLGDMADLREGIDQGLSRDRSLDFLVQDGLWKLRSNDAKGARAALEEALKLNPADLRALEALRRTYIAEKNAPLALQKVKEYAARQPQSAPVQDFLGLLLIAGGDVTSARSAFTAAKRADPNLVNADLSLVQIDVSEGKLDDARKRLHGLLESDSGNLTARRWIGNIDALRGDHNAAIQHFQQVVAADPNDAQASNNLAYLLTEYRSDHDAALKFAEKAVELNPTAPEFCDTLGWVLYRKGVYNSAVKYLERASADPRNVVWKYHLAMAYAKAGNAQRGRAVLEAALKVNANVPEAKAAREMLEQAR
jgi:tetratricopeptide (TPR) repeat protein